MHYFAYRQIHNYTISWAIEPCRGICIDMQGRVVVGIKLGLSGHC